MPDPVAHPLTQACPNAMDLAACLQGCFAATRVATVRRESQPNALGSPRVGKVCRVRARQSLPGCRVVLPGAPSRQKPDLTQCAAMAQVSRVLLVRRAMARVWPPACTTQGVPTVANIAVNLPQPSSATHASTHASPSNVSASSNGQQGDSFGSTLTQAQNGPQNGSQGGASTPTGQSPSQGAPAQQPGSGQVAAGQAAGQGNAMQLPSQTPATVGASTPPGQSAADLLLLAFAGSAVPQASAPAAKSEPAKAASADAGKPDSAKTQPGAPAGSLANDVLALLLPPVTQQPPEAALAGMAGGRGKASAATAAGTAEAALAGGGTAAASPLKGAAAGTQIAATAEAAEAAEPPAPAAAAVPGSAASDNPFAAMLKQEGSAGTASQDAQASSSNDFSKAIDSLAAQSGSSATLQVHAAALAELSTPVAPPAQASALVASAGDTSAALQMLAPGGAAIENAMHAAAGSAASAPLGGSVEPFLTAPAQSSQISAQVLASVQGSEMRVGMHSDEWGSISIATTLSPGGVAAQIAVDHSGLGQMLVQHVPDMEQKLGSSLGMSARVEVHDTGADASGSNTGGQNQSPSRQGQQASATGNQWASQSATSHDPGLTQQDATRLSVQA